MRYKKTFWLILVCLFASLSAQQDEGYLGTELIVLESQHDDLAKLMRKLRLLNPYEKDSDAYKVWEEQAQFNVPILILASYYLDEFCQANRKKRLLFSARDCCHFKDVYKALFHRYESIYFYTSRKIYFNPSDEYVDYVKNLYSKEAVIVDGHGSGNSCRSFFLKHLNVPPCIIFIVGLHSCPLFMGYGFGHHIEMLNYASHGSLSQYTKEGPQFLPLEYDSKKVAPAYACIRRCIALLNNYYFKPFDQNLMNSLLRTLQLHSPQLKKYHIQSHTKPNSKLK
jgi:hypothetical protein